jgi:hypothetical protein
VLACINMHWIARALTPEVAVERYLEPLRRAARQLEAGYAASLGA